MRRSKGSRSNSRSRGGLLNKGQNISNGQFTSPESQSESFPYEPPTHLDTSGTKIASSAAAPSLSRRTKDQMIAKQVHDFEYGNQRSNTNGINKDATAVLNGAENFANFDAFDVRIVQKSNGKAASNRNGIGNDHGDDNDSKTRRASSRQRRRQVAQALARSRSRSRSRSKMRTSKTDAEIDTSGTYDPEDVATYKWAKFQANDVMDNSGHAANNGDKSSAVRPPASAGFLRSTSVSNQRKFYQMAKERARSKLRSEKDNDGADGNASRNSNGIGNLNGSANGSQRPPMNGVKTRTRSNSPIPTSRAKNINYNIKDETERTGNSSRSRNRNSAKPIIASSRSLKPSSRGGGATSTSASASTKQPTKLSEQEMRIQNNYANKKYDFQSPSSSLVTCRAFDHQNRIAFEKRRLITIADLYEAAQLPQPRGGDSTINARGMNIHNNNRLKRISPSPQQLELLHAMENISSTRQLCWSPAVSPDADPFFGWDDENASDDQGNDEVSTGTSHGKGGASNPADRARRRKMLLAKKRRESSSKRNGKYRRMDIRAYIEDTLPDHQPILTNKRMRLPMRSDVGFPRATEEEIRKKQEEIMKEAQLEEISPRLVVLLNGDDLGNDRNHGGGRNRNLHRQSSLGFAFMRGEIPFETDVLEMDRDTPSFVKKVGSDSRGQKDVSKKRRKCPKPNIYSIFAPPMDATASSTEIWRARPFSDRPPGLIHALAIPVDVKFAVGSIEPLVCTLSLYILPKATVPSDKQPVVRGKISEDFIFPAGEWSDMLNEKAGKIIAEEFGMLTSASSLESGSGSPKRRNKKALFSYDPAVLPSSSPTNGRESLYICMQVHKVAHMDADEAYLEHSKVHSSFSGFSRKGSLGSVMFGGGNKQGLHRDSSAAEQRAKQAFETFGTQFLTPVCFGIVPLFPTKSHDDHLHWPRGVLQTMQLYSFQNIDNSEANFIGRLISIAEHIEENPSIIDDTDQSLGSADSASLESQSTFESMTPEDMIQSKKKKKKNSFRIKRNKKSKQRQNSIDTKVDSSKVEGLKPVDGYAIFHTSMIEGDISQSLLQSPSLLNSRNIEHSPRLLVDASGDCAIMVNPEQRSSSSGKRSNLIRLPPAKMNAGYADSSEVREVLYLPPKTDDGSTLFNPVHGGKHNLLYLFPSLIFKEREDSLQKGQSLSLRIRLVRQDGADTPYRPEPALYNPSLLGDPIIEASYTKIPLNTTLKKLSNGGIGGLSLRDEIKIRLPEVLDGSHSIQFSLYTVEIATEFAEQSGGPRQSLVAEAAIPLSSSGAKESSTGTKVSTVLPDRLHKIQLSTFQLHVYSRLVSHIHFNDPAVAAVVQEFSPDVDDKNGRKEYIPYSHILSKATQESVCNYFQPLLFVHLRHLISQGMFGFKFNSGEVIQSRSSMVILETSKSLLELLERVKKSALRFFYSELSLGKLLKFTFDIFDEGHFHGLDSTDSGLLEGSTPSFGTHASTGSSESREIDNSFDTEEIAKDSNEQNISGGSEKIPLEKPSHITLSSRIISTDKDRLRHIYSSLKSSSPINRTAYGISKLDRMKAEAELYESDQILTELADDDETVVTASTWQSQARIVSSSMNSVAPSPLSANQNHNAGKEINNLLGHHAEDRDKIEGENASIETPFERAKDFARRMNSAARVFVAPCVTPDVRRGSTKPIRKKLGSSKRIRDMQQFDPRIQSLRAQLKAQSSVPTKHLIYEGSDDENDDKIGSRKSASRKVAALPGTHSLVELRGLLANEPLEIQFSLSDNAMLDSGDPPPYLYEIIFALWLHCFTSNLREKDTGSKTTMNVHPYAFLRQMDFLLPLCLKSFVLRCSSKRRRLELIPSLVLDVHHMQILDPLLSHIAFALVLQITNSSKKSVENVMISTLRNSDCIIDFLVGLLAVIHPAQVSFLISRYFKTLRDCEDAPFDEEFSNKQYFKRLRCCRLLQLRAVERFASMPRFAALNVPFRYHPDNQYKTNQASSWINQALTKPAEQNSATPQPVMSPALDQTLPKRHWLAELLLETSFRVCLLSCDAVVNGTVYQSKNTLLKKAKKKESAMRQRIPLADEDIADYQTTAYHAITIVYESILRKQATNSQFQSGEKLSRIAGIFLAAVVNNTIDAVSCLSKMEPMDKVRSTWLLCVVYVLQEAPEVAIRENLLSLCNQSKSKENQVIGFLKILKLCASTFQGFASEEFTPRMSPWLIQESFNTVSAASIVLVDECCDVLSSTNPYELDNLTEGVLGLLLKIISTPLSSVTLLRGLGAVSQVLEKVGAALFLKATGDSFQHWGRMFFTLMNSTSLSVRSMAVDLMVSLFGLCFKEGGNIDEITQIFVTILPETVAREIALYGSNALIKNAACVERSMWPLRRALADIEDADPFDDDRVDASLMPFLKQFCRVCQAVIDGVIIELRLLGDKCVIVGSRVNMVSGALRSDHSAPLAWAFDADEESLFEVAEFFSPETRPLQKLRWLMTLKRLHEFKGQWVEAAETLILCARTAADAIPHINNTWRPSIFPEWNNLKAVASFCEDFLEPSQLQSKMGLTEKSRDSNALPTPKIMSLCEILTNVSKESVIQYEKEGHMIPLAYSRLQEVMKIVVAVVDDHAASSFRKNNRRGIRNHKQNFTEDIAALRKVSAAVNELVTKLAEEMHLISGENDSSMPMSVLANMFKYDEETKQNGYPAGAVYVRVMLFGKKSHRFQESTTIPTFLDWASPYICRVPSGTVSKATSKVIAWGRTSNQDSVASEMCRLFAEPLIMALQEELSSNLIRFSPDIPDDAEVERSECLFLVVTPVNVRVTGRQNDVQSKRFQVRKQGSGPQNIEHVTDITVARPFPCALSRQASVVTSNFIAQQSPSFF